MKKSSLDTIREFLEGVKNPFLFFIVVSFGFFIAGALTLVGVYFYTRR